MYWECVCTLAVLGCMSVVSNLFKIIYCDMRCEQITVIFPSLIVWFERFLQNWRGKVINFFHKEKAILCEFLFILYSYKMKIHHETYFSFYCLLVKCSYFSPLVNAAYITIDDSEILTAKLSQCMSRDFFQKSTKICFNVRYLTLMNKSFDVFCTTISQKRSARTQLQSWAQTWAQKLGESKSIYKNKFKSSWRLLEQTAEVDFVREKKLQNFNNNSQTDKVWHTG